MRRAFGWGVASVLAACFALLAAGSLASQAALVLAGLGTQTAPHAAGTQPPNGAPPAAVPAVSEGGGQPHPAGSQPRGRGRAPGARPDCPQVSTMASHNVIVAGPVPASYRYRVAGSYRDVSAGSPPVSYAGQLDSRIENVQPNATTGGFSYDQVQTYRGSVTDTTFTYIPPTAASQTLVGSLPVAGLYISKVVTSNGLTSIASSTWRPAWPGILLLEVPAAVGNVWESSGTDPSTGVTEQWMATQVHDEFVDTCGEVVDSLAVHLNGNIEVSENAGGVAPTTVVVASGGPARVLGPHTNDSFTADFAIADPYGGLLSAYSFSLAGNDGSATVVRDFTATIETVPRPGQLLALSRH